MGSSNYQIHISKEFPGVVRNAKIIARAYVEGHENTLLVNTNPNLCRKRGDLKCDFCDLERTTAIAATPYDCFYTCPDFGYYIDNANAKCLECHPSCRYCYNNANRDNCYLCNSTALFI